MTFPMETQQGEAFKNIKHLLELFERASIYFALFLKF